MTQFSDRGFIDHPQRAPSELLASWDHLVSAAGHGARQVGQTSRRRARLAGDRAGAARLALLGELPRPAWRWLGIGLAAGLAVGAVGATVLARARRGAERAEADQATTTVPAAPSKIRDKAGAGAEVVRERTRVAVQRAATSARGAAIEFRDKLVQRDSKDAPEGPA